MEAPDFNDAFLDTQYLKLDEGALGFIFTRERVAKALALSAPDAKRMLADNHGALVDLMAVTTRRILHEAFYTRLFEDLSALPDEQAYPFIHLALRRLDDPEVEAARVKVVKAFQDKRKK